MIPDRSEHDVRDVEDAVIVRARARAKAAWAASMREDDRLHRAASEKRLAASWPRPRVLPVRSFVMGGAAACCAMLLAFAVWRSGGAAVVEASAPAHAARPGAPATATTAAAGTASAASATNLVAVPIVAPPAAPNAESRLATRAMVVIGACPECRVGGAKMEPGITVATGRALSVPRGSRITLGFAMGAASAPLVDPAVGIDVEGPAEATSPDPQTLALDRGSARFRGLSDVIVRVPGGVVESTGATFTVRVDAQGVAHVAVESGRAVVTSDATHDTRKVEAGATFDLAKPAAGAGSTAHGAPASATAHGAAARATAAPASGGGAATTAADVTAAAVSAGPDDSLDAVSRARARFHDGDASGARTQLEALTHAHDAAVARRASFTLAEIEMASGEREHGRARLAELTTSPDVRLASDAATLLARSEPTAAGRADAWGRYLATSPPVAYRDRALLERADALVDAGRTNEANAVLNELRGASLSEAQQRQLARISAKANERH